MKYNLSLAREEMFDIFDILYISEADIANTLREGLFTSEMQKRYTELLPKIKILRKKIGDILSSNGGLK